MILENPMVQVQDADLELSTAADSIYETPDHLTDVEEKLTDGRRRRRQRRSRLQQRKVN